jgi:hypothetical protein
MGCDKYYLEGMDYPIAFSEMNDDVCCLCTFGHNDGTALDPERVRSLAYLGAAVVLVSHGQADHGYIPSCLPDWIKQEIDRIVLKDKK